jgi:hypothetical protein
MRVKVPSPDVPATLALPKAVVSVATVGIAIYDWQNVSSRIADVNASTEFAMASVGWGCGQC